MCCGLRRRAPERIHVIHNGIDTDLYRPVADRDALARYGIDPDRPYVLFLGRITRQKGIVHLARAIPSIDPVRPGRPVRGRA